MTGRSSSVLKLIGVASTNKTPSSSWMMPVSLYMPAQQAFPQLHVYKYPDNPYCVAILNDKDANLLNFTICVRNNTQLDFEYAAKIFTTYLYKKGEIFQVPSLEDL